MTETPFTNDVELLVLERIEEHACENGIIVVEESNYSVLLTSPSNLLEIDSIRFVPYTKVESFHTSVRKRPDGKYIVDKICQLLLDHYGERAKPVVFLRRDGTHWVGMVGENKRRLHAIDYLNRCLEAPYGDPQS
jgi:hypothetical protein